ncbi:MAG: 5'/3'-nucleotidase SurE [Paludibacteraceae bacterium]|nr:5'/3'-nucleotidase SurE [Paludibacteraceae bacterium]
MRTILVTNDDGITARGINALVDAIKDSYRVVVVAPDGPRSAQSKAITVTTPLRYWKQYTNGNLVMYRCNGTPCDCVKIGLYSIMDTKPDLLVSGINHGTNTSVNVIYSGTMGAALEGCVEGLPSIGLSLCSYDQNADLTEAVKFSKKLIEMVLNDGLPQGVCLNVNFPVGAIKGLKVVRQSRGRWRERFVERDDPAHNKYYWLTGDFNNLEPDATDTDEYAISQGYGSIVPCHVDLTHYDSINKLSNLNCDAKEI